MTARLRERPADDHPFEHQILELYQINYGISPPYVLYLAPPKSPRRYPTEVEKFFIT